MRRSLIILVAAFILAALVPSAALAAKPAPSINVSCSGVASFNSSTWALSGSASWTGQPGGTTPIPYALVYHPDSEAGYMITTWTRSNFALDAAKKPTSMTINAVYVDDWGSSWTSPGDRVYLGVAFVAKNGTWKHYTEVLCADALPTLGS